MLSCLISETPLKHKNLLMIGTICCPQSLILAYSETRAIICIKSITMTVATAVTLLCCSCCCQMLDRSCLAVLPPCSGMARRSTETACIILAAGCHPILQLRQWFEISQEPPSSTRDSCRSPQVALLRVKNQKTRVRIQMVTQQTDE